MADTVRTLTALQALLANNTERAISEQDLRDALVSGMGVVAYVAKTATYSASEDDEFIAVSATSADVTINLPAAATTRVGKRYVIKLVDDTHDCIINPNASELLDNSATSITMTTLFETIVIVNSGAKWWVESHYIPA